MYPATIALICCALWTCGVAMDSESMEMQTEFLTGIYESVKDRQLEEGELNLLPNQSAGFANAIRSFSEKGNASEWPGVALINARSGEQVSGIINIVAGNATISMVVWNYALHAERGFDCTRTYAETEMRLT